LACQSVQINMTVALMVQLCASSSDFLLICSSFKQSVDLTVVRSLEVRLQISIVVLIDGPCQTRPRLLDAHRTVCIVVSYFVALRKKIQNTGNLFRYAQPQILKYIQAKETTGGRRQPTGGMEKMLTLSRCCNHRSTTRLC
jgi:hypothetical protein